MSDIKKMKDGLLLKCDCGAVHQITKDENGNYLVSSTFAKKQKEKIEEKKENEEEENFF